MTEERRRGNNEHQESRKRYIWREMATEIWASLRSSPKKVITGKTQGPDCMHCAREKDIQTLK